MSLDPLVQVWRDVRRPLNWQSWPCLSHAEQAHLRWLLMDELRWLDVCRHRLPSAHWRRAHRDLLELKAACGQAAQETPCAAV